MSDVFMPVNRDQTFLMSFDFREVLGDDHLVWTVLEVVESLDLSALYARYGDHPQGGRPAFDPQMMLALLVYGYAHGLGSSRDLERACRLNFDYRAITANQEPDHATIARFRVSLDQELASLFAQVLGICRDLGLGKLGLVAVDGTKIEASASKSKNRTQGQLDDLEEEARRILAEAAQADSTEQSTTETVRPQPGDRLLTVEAAKARLAEKRMQPPVRAEQKKKPLVNLTDPDSGFMKAAEGGFLQGYNAQAVATEDQLVIAAQVSREGVDVHLLGPMLEAAASNLAATGTEEKLGTVVADAGYWSEANSQLEGADLLIATTKGYRVEKGRQEPKPIPTSPLSLAERTERRKPMIEAAARGGITYQEAAARLGLSYIRTWELVKGYKLRGEEALVLQRQPNRAGFSPKPPTSAAVARQAMEAKISQPENLARYRKRAWVIEGVFAHAKSHRGYRRFLRRGLPAVDAEWKLIHLAANVRKAHRRRTQPPLPSPLGPGRRSVLVRRRPTPSHRSVRCWIRRVERHFLEANSAQREQLSFATRQVSL